MVQQRRDPEELARLGLWPGSVYRDLRAVEVGELTDADFAATHARQEAVLVIDTTGLTATSLRLGVVRSLVRIMWFHEICEPVLRAHDARWVKGYADDLVARFESAEQALRTGFELHDTVAAHNAEGGDAPQVCLGIGYGELLIIGEHTPWGDEMNKASKLGEDTAAAQETLLTEAAYEAARDLGGVRFERVTSEGLPFPYVRATRISQSNPLVARDRGGLWGLQNEPLHRVADDLAHGL